MESWGPKLQVNEASKGEKKPAVQFQFHSQCFWFHRKAKSSNTRELYISPQYCKDWRFMIASKKMQESALDFYFQVSLFLMKTTHSQDWEKKTNQKTKNERILQILSCQLLVAYFSRKSQCIGKYMCILLLYIMRLYCM